MYLKSKPPTDTPAPTFTPDLDGLIAWLETQDGATEYDSASREDCLLCRFASAVDGAPRVWSRALEIFPQYRVRSLAYQYPSTYANALSGARALKASASPPEFDQYCDPRPAPIPRRRTYSILIGLIPRRRTYSILIGLMVAAFAVGFLFGLGVGR